MTIQSSHSFKLWALNRAKWWKMYKYEKIFVHLSDISLPLWIMFILWIDILPIVNRSPVKIYNRTWWRDVKYLMSSICRKYMWCLSLMAFAWIHELIPHTNQLINAEMWFTIYHKRGGEPRSRWILGNTSLFACCIFHIYFENWSCRWSI